jgi:hypothetical protein
MSLLPSRLTKSHLDSYITVWIESASECRFQDYRLPLVASFSPRPHLPMPSTLKISASLPTIRL